jgi:hypothetical protein
MTQIRVTQAQRDQLNELKNVGESYADVLASEFGIGGESVYAGVELSRDDCESLLNQPPREGGPDVEDVVSEVDNVLVVPPKTFLSYFESGDNDAE